MYEYYIQTDGQVMVLELCCYCDSCIYEYEGSTASNTASICTAASRQ